MKCRRVLACFLAALALVASVAFGGEPEEQAVAAAESWLALVDGGDYEQSWEQSAELFRGAVSKEKWGQSVSAARGPLGELVSRTVESTTYATTLPGAPDGEYVVIQFSTSFTNKKSAVETVTPMKDPDGAWRVSGYYVK